MAKKKRKPKSSAKKEAKSTQASAASRSGGLERALPPHSEEPAAFESRALSLDSSDVAEMYGVEKGLIDALDELEQSLGLNAIADDTPRSLAMAPDGRVGMSNILGYGIGLKVSNDTTQPIPCMKVYVANKVHPGEVDEGAIPAEIGGYPTDVEEIAPPIAYGRSRCGGGCSPAGFSLYGTIGAICVRDNKPLILSNNHVLAATNRAGVGTYINSSPGREYLGRLERVVALGQNNIVDAALAWTDETKYTSPHHRFYSMNPEPIEARIGTNVKKDGATTNFTFGMVKARIRRLTGVKYDIGFINFEDVIVVQGLFGGYFSQPGDSGSLIVDYDHSRPTALLFAGGGNQTYGIPIQTVIRVLGIERFIGGDEE